MTAPAEVDYGRKAHEAAEAHVEACEKALRCREGECEQHEPEDTYAGRGCPDPAHGPYCGCTTCAIREAIAAAWPIAVEGVKAGQV